MEKEQPDIKFRLLSVFRKKLIPLIELNNKINQGVAQDKMKVADEIKECTICGMPSSSEICSKCKRVSELFEVKKRKNGNKKEELEITFDDLKNIMEREKVILLDVRDKIEYLTKTLEGAINIPAQEIERRWKELLKFKKTHKIIVFCNAGTTSYAVTIKLKNLGFDAYNLEGGILNIVNDGNNDANQNQSQNLPDDKPNQTNTLYKQ
jgi:rhodanese-related sulfurtransferase